MNRPVLGLAQDSAVVFTGTSVAQAWGVTIAEYVLPLAVAFGVVMFVTWWLRRKDDSKITRELEQAHDLADQRQQERDLAQEELFRRLYEERELNKEKIQFQSQLTDYEKYAALAQLALGAAHEINNPLI